jgi:hypothetical protein
LAILARRRQHGIQPLRKKLVRLAQACDRADSSRFPAVGDGEPVRWRRQSLGHGMRRTAVEDASDSVPKQPGVDALVLPNEQQVHEISRARGSAALVRSRVRVQLLGDLPLQWNQQDLEWAEPQLAQESWSPLGLSIPGIRRCDRDIHLERLERPTGKGALQPVPHRETDAGVAQLLAADDGEAEVIAGVLDGGTLEVGTGCPGAVHVIGVHVD